MTDMGFLGAIVSLVAPSILAADLGRLAEARAMEAESRVKREARRANEAQELVAELQEQLEIRKAEQADELATWEGWDGAFDAETVVDLLAWEEKVQAGAGEAKDDRKHA